MQWYYVEGESARGPVDAAQIEILATRGTIQPQTLIWREGMANWEPFQAVAARGELRAAAPATTPLATPTYEHPAMQAPPDEFNQANPGPLPQGQVPPGPDQVSYCSACGRRLPLRAMHVHGAQVLCPSCFDSMYNRNPTGAPGSPQYAAPYAAPYAAIPQLNYAGFWIRFVARIIDVIILAILTYPLQRMLSPDSFPGFRVGDPQMHFHLPQNYYLFLFLRGLMDIAYNSGFVWLTAGTPGKLMLGLRVVRADGSRIGLLRAIGRDFAYFISAIIILIGYIMAAFHPEKAALHDLICDTRVVHKE